ncbi:MAG: glutamyl-tRNA reductase [Gammaproteobacteria bacterium]|nr:MAG: glutamyl-tRNA reductase [Gammaproteobacteria bacterium]
MSLLALGINHKTAPVEVREKVAFAPERMDESLRSLKALEPVLEAVIVSTCNRTELYCRMDREQPDAEHILLEWMSATHGVPEGELGRYAYVHRGPEAIRHLLRVACGLDSLVLGEPQILGQLKSAWQDARHAGTLGRQLGRLFQHAFSVAKQVRTDTAIGESAVSVAFAAVSLARQIFGELDRQTALLIGAGETIELTARHLSANRIGRMLVANRSLDRAERLAELFGGEALTLPGLPERLAEADIIISSTASPLPILGKGMVERALKERRHRPMFMVDIAVPRDIEPEVGELDDVFLYTVDDLQAVIEENIASRQEAAAQAEEIIDSRVDEFLGWLRGQGAVETITEYRSGAARTADELLQRARGMIARGKSPDEALAWLAHTLTNKLTHAPTQRLNELAREGRSDLIDQARSLLGLDEDDPKRR